MSALSDYPLEFIDDMPLINPKRVGRTFTKMSKSTKSVEAPAKTYNKTRGEHFKDMVIVALVIGIAAFAGGVQFAKGNQAEIERAVSALQPTAQAVAPDAKK